MTADQILAPAPDSGTPQNDEAFRVTVYGTPGPQGSKKPVGDAVGRNGQRYTVMKESSAKVKPWRAAVEQAARTVLFSLPYRQRLRFPLTGPLEVDMQITVEAPIRIPTDRYLDGVAYPTCYPDLSKLLRSTEDALTTAGIWGDDALVVRYRDLAKHYPGQPGGLDAPGAVIRIFPLRRQE